jgi:hypothetical protein
MTAQEFKFSKPKYEPTDIIVENRTHSYTFWLILAANIEANPFFQTYTALSLSDGRIEKLDRRTADMYYVSYVEEIHG